MLPTGWRQGSLVIKIVIKYRVLRSNQEKISKTSRFAQAVAANHWYFSGVSRLDLGSSNTLLWMVAEMLLPGMTARAFKR